MTTIIQNIGRLYVVPCGPITGPQMRNIPCIEKAALVIENEKIAWFGQESALSSHEPRATSHDQTIDAQNGCVIPGLIDCHTHTVFAGSREKEFVQRIGGKSYLEIAQMGGGIRSTVQAVRQVSQEQLIELAYPRLQRMLQQGVTTVEIKSGYGLSVDDELKILQTISGLKSYHLKFKTQIADLPWRDPKLEILPEIVPTYLAAHAVPEEFDGQADRYLDTVLADEVLTKIRREKLAEFIDVFCEKSAFDVAQSRRVLEAGKKHGLTPKIHADQISQIGASRMASQVGAISADHLEHVDEAGLAAMKQAGTLAVLLPGCSFFLGVSQAPGRRIMEAGLPVAIATDFNPGSSHIGSLPLVMSIACTQLRITPIEVLVAATANAAAALNRQDRLGAIQMGHQADLIILDCPSIEHFLYTVGHYPVRSVIQAGRLVFNSNCH